MLECPPALIPCDISCPRCDPFPFIPLMHLTQQSRDAVMVTFHYLLYKTRPAGIRFNDSLVLLLFSFSYAIYKEPDCSVSIRSVGLLTEQPVFEFRQEQGIFPIYLKRPYQLWRPPNLLCNGCLGLFRPWIKQQGL
jgi:hypothetical protein